MGIFVAPEFVNPEFSRVSQNPQCEMSDRNSRLQRSGEAIQELLDSIWQANSRGSLTADEAT
jgi:hypothetical protein